MTKFDEKNATADEIKAYRAGRDEALDAADGVPKTVADIHKMSRDEVVRHKKTVDHILRTQPGMSRREALTIDSENE
jgi:hypothetical protein